MAVDQERIMKRLGERIKKARKKQGMTQAELVERLGYDRGTLSEYETGTRKLPAAQLPQLAEALDVPNGIAEPKLLRLLRAQADLMDAEDIDVIVMLLAAQLPTRRVDDTATRALLAEVERKIAEMEPDLGRVHSPLARAVIESDLAGLAEQAALYREHLSRGQGGMAIDFDAMRQALLELAGNPELLSQPDAELKLFVAKCFPVLYIAGGEIVPAPAV